MGLQSVTPAGYSGTPLVRKLGIKAGSACAVIDPPAAYLDLLVGVPDDVEFGDGSSHGLEFVHVFARNQEGFADCLARLRGTIAQNGMIWVSWPKKSSGVVTDLSGRVVRQVGPTWFVLANEHRLTAERAGRWSERPHMSGLQEALGALEQEWNTIEVLWGRLSRHQRPLPGAPIRLDPPRASLAVGGGPGALGSIFTFNTFPFGSASPRIGRGGNSFVKVIESGSEVQAASILNYGQSGDPASPHFFDQAELYADRRFKPAWFSRADVEANSVRTYTVR